MWLYDSSNNDKKNHTWGWCLIKKMKKKIAKNAVLEKVVFVDSLKHFITQYCKLLVVILISNLILGPMVEKNTSRGSGPRGFLTPLVWNLFTSVSFSYKSMRLLFGFLPSFSFVAHCPSRSNTDVPPPTLDWETWLIEIIPSLNALLCADLLTISGPKAM